MPLRSALNQAIFLGWNNRFRFSLGNKVEKLIGVIATFSQHRRKVKAFEQRNGLCRIPFLPARQQQAQRHPEDPQQCSNDYINFCAKAVNTPSQSLLCLIIMLIGYASGARICADHSTINQQSFHIRVCYKMRMLLIPYPFIRPSAKSLENHIPDPQCIGQVSTFDNYMHNSSIPSTKMWA